MSEFYLKMNWVIISKYDSIVSILSFTNEIFIFNRWKKMFALAMFTLAHPLKLRNFGQVNQRQKCSN